MKEKGAFMKGRRQRKGVQGVLYIPSTVLTVDIRNASPADDEILGLFVFGLPLVYFNKTRERVLKICLLSKK